MMSTALSIAAGRLGDMLGTHLYTKFGVFQACVIAITIVCALILAALLLVPQKLISTREGEINNLAFAEFDEDTRVEAPP